MCSPRIGIESVFVFTGNEYTKNGYSLTDEALRYKMLADIMVLVEKNTNVLESSLEHWLVVSEKNGLIISRAEMEFSEEVKFKNKVKRNKSDHNVRIGERQLIIKVKIFKC